MLSFRPAFSLSSFTFIKRLFSSCPLSSNKVLSSAYLRMLIFLQAVLIPACKSSSSALHMMYSACKLNKHGANFSLGIFLSQIWTSSFFPYQVFCFLSCIQVSREACNVVWYSHLFKNIPQFVVIHTVKVFSRVNEAEVDVLFCWNSLAFYMIQHMLAIWSLIPLPFLIPACISWNSRFTYCWRLAWMITCEISAIVQ